MYDIDYGINLFPKRSKKRKKGRRVKNEYPQIDLKKLKKGAKKYAKIGKKAGKGSVEVAKGTYRAGKAVSKGLFGAGKGVTAFTKKAYQKARKKARDRAIRKAFKNKGMEVY